jgi:asparagine synthase (glutamine-hydrolysing)
MCGIAGVFNLSAGASISLNKVKNMIHQIKHRGPDEFGLYIDDKVAIGNARLSIIDLAGGTQPISNEIGSLWIVYNGEIFNYPELKNTLVKQGHKFKTTTDTEVLLHLYEEKGIKLLDDLNGQFSFAIWDSVKKELFMARDRVGILPLFYTISKKQFIFASEIKSILAYNSESAEIDNYGLEQVFTFWSTLAPQTIFKNIFELKPGHFIKISSTKVYQQKYWDLPFVQPSEQYSNSIETNVEIIKELLFDSINIRLRADVPVGSYLSGGLDSSGITACIKKNFNNSLRTFGIRFEEKNFDEGEYQKEMVSYLNTDHSEYLANNIDIGQELPEIIWQVEKPILRLAPIPLFFLSKLVRKSNFKVVITGEGADEIFGGYDIFKETKIRDFWSRRPDSKYRPILLTKLYPDIFRDQALTDVLKSFFKLGIDQPDQPFFSHIIRWKNTSRIKNFYSVELKEAIKNYDVLNELQNDLPEDFSRWDYLSKAQYLEIKTFLSSYLLSSQGDRVAMANSVEIRVPYLDHRIMEFMCKIPARMKIQGLSEKYLLKKALKDLLPSKILNRAKHPYRAPIRQSLINHNLLFVNDQLSENKIKAAGLFDYSKVQKLVHKLEKMNNTSEVDNMALCGILTTQIIVDQLNRNISNSSYDENLFRLIIDHRTISNN